MYLDKNTRKLYRCRETTQNTINTIQYFYELTLQFVDNRWRTLRKFDMQAQNEFKVDLGEIGNSSVLLEFRHDGNVNNSLWYIAPRNWNNRTSWYKLFDLTNCNLQCQISPDNDTEFIFTIDKNANIGGWISVMVLSDDAKYIRS